MRRDIKTRFFLFSLSIFIFGCASSVPLESKPSVDPMAYRMKTEGGAGHGHRREPEIQTRWGFKERGVSASGEADGDSARTRNTSAKYFQGSTPRLLHVHTRLQWIAARRATSAAPRNIQFLRL